MKNMKRILLTVVSAMLLVAVSVAGTLAWLSDTTNTVNNTFTYGNVSFDEALNGGLDEAKVNEYGELVNANGQTKEQYEEANKENPDAPAWTPAERVTSNVYKLIPMTTYIKDPIVHISESSEPCWVFVKVYNGLDGTQSGLLSIETEDESLTIAAQMTAKGWVCVDTTANIWGYTEIVEPGEDVPVFDTFTLNDAASQDALKGIIDSASCTIKVQAYAVQAEGLETMQEAWSAAPFTGWSF